jgi:hypothetical protein
MVSHRRLTGFSLAFLLLVMQAFWLAHRLEHGLSPGVDEETACEFCLAMQGMEAAPPGLDRVPAVIPVDEYRPAYAFILHVDAQPIQPRQQGPPTYS